MKHKFEAVKSADGSYRLVKDGIVSICPKTSYPNIQQTAIGSIQVQLLRFACSTSCPFANIDHDAKVKKELEEGSLNEGTNLDLYYFVGCEHGDTFFKLDEVIEEERKEVIQLKPT